MDLRVKKTYGALIAACTKLLSENRFEDMSVAMLCDEALIRRTTFYKHFADKAEFFAFYVENLRIDMVERGRRLADDEGVFEDDALERRAILREFADYLLEHEDLMDNIFSSSMSGVLIAVICDKIAESFYDRARRTAPKEAAAPGDLVDRAEFAAGGVVRVMMRWWDEENRAERRDDFVETSAGLAARILDE